MPTRRKSSGKRKTQRRARGNSSPKLSILNIGKNYEIHKFLKKLKSMSPLKSPELRRLAELKGKGKKRKGTKKRRQRGGT